MRESVRVTVSAVALVATLTGALPSLVEARQNDGSAPSFWVTVGLGGSVWTGGEEFDSGGEGIALVGQLSYQTGRHVVSLRSSIVAELFADALIDVGLLYGRGTAGRSNHGSISAGLAWVYSERCGGLFSSTACRTESTIGVPIVAEASFRAKYIGAGAQVFANLNTAHSVIGLAVILQLGSLY